jgi:Transposase DDE domain
MLVSVDFVRLVGIPAVFALTDVSTDLPFLANTVSEEMSDAAPAISISITNAVSQRCRKRIEEVFGWIKGSARLTQVKLRGRAKVDAAFTLALSAYNLIRLPKLLATPA